MVTSGFVLGFVIGPLLWAPMSEVYGRRNLFIFTYILFTIFNGAVVASQNVWTLIILRFLAGTAGSSPLTNAGGTVSDVFSAKQRGLGMAVFAAAPFLGPAVGPIVSAPFYLQVSAQCANILRSVDSWAKQGDGDGSQLLSPSSAPSSPLPEQSSSPRPTLLSYSELELKD